MRELIFRAKRKWDKEWIYGYLYINSNDGRNFILVYGDLIEDFTAEEVISETVGQYTGLQDKNGKKIFEGDIYKIKDDYNEYGMMAGEIREIYYKDGGFRLKPINNNRNSRGFWMENGNDGEVIGNIHGHKNS